jgi:hypothetical protein
MPVNRRQLRRIDICKKGAVGTGPIIESINGGSSMEVKPLTVRT